MVQQIAVTQNSTPHGHLGLIDRLGICRVRSIAAAGSIRQSVTSCELPTGQVGLGVLRSAERWRTRTHIDVGCETTVDHGGTGIKRLDHCQPKKCLRILLYQSGR